MARKPVARLGDPGSHGGNISTGSSAIHSNSRPIACVGDIYACPVHGLNPIITGAPHEFGLGKLIAHVGSETACGANILAGSPDIFITTIDTSPTVNILSDFLKEITFVEFQLVDILGQPIANQNFVLILPDNKTINGVLDGEGRVHVANVPRGTCHIRFPDIEDLEHPYE